MSDTPRTDAAIDSPIDGPDGLDIVRRLTTLCVDLERELTTAKKAYLDVADAVCRESTGPNDVCRRAREVRAEKARLIEEIEMLRSYGNKECTAMADDALERMRR